MLLESSFSDNIPPFSFPHYAMLSIFLLPHFLLFFRCSIVLPSTRARGLRSCNSNGSTILSRKPFSPRRIHEIFVTVRTSHEAVALERQLANSVCSRLRSVIESLNHCPIRDIGRVWSRETEFSIGSDADLLTTRDCNVHEKVGPVTVYKDSPNSIYNG